MADHEKYPVEVLTPEGLVFDGEVEMLSTRTTTGEIGIMARHAPLMAILNPALLRLHIGEDEVKKFAQGEGYLQVFENRAMVLVEEAVSPDQLDVELLRSKLEDAQQRLVDSDGKSAEARACEREIKRIETFIQVATDQQTS